MKKLLDFIVIVAGCFLVCLILYLLLLDKKSKPVTFKQSFDHFFR